MLGAKLCIAAINAPERCVVSGLSSEIEDLQNRLTEQGIECRLLRTSHAFHSQMMDSIIESFKSLLAKVNLNPPKIPFLSNVTGTWITTEEVTDNSYWVKHLRSSVRFADGISELCKQSNRIFLEVGFGRTLSTLTKQQSQGQLVLCSIGHPHGQQSDVAFLLNPLGNLWLYGIQVDLSSLYANEKRYRLPLPTYPFERKRYWVESTKVNNLNQSRNEEINNFREKSQDSFVESHQNNILKLDSRGEKYDNFLQKILNKQIAVMFQQLNMLEKDM
jgi:acyl transferase domain-containing protein